jgi:cysteine desulfurase
MKDYLYLDYAANTPVDEEVLKTFNNATLKYFANPNATHGLGVEVNEKIIKTTDEIINLFKENTCLNDNMEIVYTSGSSESNNLAIKGVVQSYKENGKHIISTFLEHSSVSSPLSYLKEQGYEIDIVGITSDGKVDVDELKRLIRDDTILVSVCYVDSEVGNVQPIQEIAEIVSKYPNCFLHVDATQAVGKTEVDFSGIDLISFAPHKFNGLNGFGGLLKKKDMVLEPLINGGASTTIYRSGTPVIGQICALEKALELTFDNFKKRYEYVNKLNEKLRSKLLSYDNVKINTVSKNNPYILNVSVNGIKAVDFKKELEEYGVCISIKSACTVTITPSRIVMSMTHDRKRAFASWRISLSHLVTEEDIDKFLEIFDKCYKEMM